MTLPRKKTLHVETHRNIQLSQWFGFVLRGMCMGIADLLPGVSGGTIALLTGIYPRFIQALSGIRGAIKHLYARNISDAFFACDGWLLSALAFGITISIVGGAHAVHWLMQHYLAETLSAFCALILYTGTKLFIQTGFATASTSIVQRAYIVFFCAFGFALAFWINDILAMCMDIVAPNKLEGEAIGWFVFVLGGSAAISVMLLPGISGSLLLLTLGLYQPLLTAITTADFVVIGAFSSGVLIGLLFFTPLLHYCYTNHRPLTLAVLSGLCWGSLRNTASQPIASAIATPSLWLTLTYFCLGGFIMALCIDLAAKTTNPH